jgi:hypothetical protein
VKCEPLTDQEYADILAEQDGHCALCPGTSKRGKLHTDHDHRTGLIRGLLCFRCNRALPAYVDAAWLRRAADYLDRVLV